MPSVGEIGGGPDARQHHDLRRAERAGRHDDLAAATRGARRALLAETYAGGALALEDQALDQATGLQPQVRPLQHRLEEAARRRPAPAALLVDVEIAGAFIVAGIEIGDRLDAVLRRRLAPGVEDVPAQARKFDAPFAAGRVVLAWPEEMVLVLLEIGQHVLPGPAGQPELAPMVVVTGLAAHIDHGVDGRGAADHLAARVIEAATVETRLGFRLEHPVRARIADGEQIADRNVEPDPVVAAAGFQQQHALGWIGGQPVGQHAAGRACAYDDVVEFALDG